MPDKSNIWYETKYHNTTLIMTKISEQKKLLLHALNCIKADFQRPLNDENTDEETNMTNTDLSKIIWKMIKDKFDNHIYSDKYMKQIRSFLWDGNVAFDDAYLNEQKDETAIQLFPTICAAFGPRYPLHFEYKILDQRDTEFRY